MKSFGRLCLVLPGAAVIWQFLAGNWLNSPRCVVDAWGMVQGSVSAFEGTPYWAKYSLCIDPYWVNQWLKNYGAGFVKRGLIGSVLRFFGDSVDLLLLNFAALLIQLIIVYLFFFFICRLFRPSALAFVSIWVALFWLTPFGKVMAETAGDPLQLILLVWFSLGALLARVTRWRSAHRMAVDLIVGLVFCMSILIYEGSCLMFLLPFLLLGRRTPAWWLSGAAALALTVAMSGAEPLELEAQISRALIGVNPLNGLEMAYRAGGGIASQVSFMDNFSMELARYLESPLVVLSELRGALSVFGVWVVAFGCFVLSGFVCSDFTLKGRALFLIRWSAAWIVIALSLVSPFLFVTHDWVRYLAILTAQLVMLLSVEGDSLRIPARSLLSSKAFPSVFLSLSSFVLLATSVALGPASSDIRTSLPPGMRMPYTILFLAGFIVALAVIVMTVRQMHNRDGFESTRLG